MKKQKVNLWILLGGLALIVPLVVLLASGFGKDPHAIRSTLIGQPAPDFQLVDLDGKTWRRTDLLGTPIVLNFWSTWCLPCKQEHGLLVHTGETVHDVRFFGIVYNDQPEAVSRYLARAGTSYPHLLDPDGRTAIDFGVTGVPETFFIDREGTIVHKHTSALNQPLLDGWLATMRSR